MNSITEILFVISNGLMIPVILCLLFLLARALFLMIIFFKDYTAHKKFKVIINEIVENPDIINSQDYKYLKDVIGDSVTKEYFLKLTDQRNNLSYCEYLLSQYQVSVQKELNKSRILIKFGPLLGLMGTLIPMGPALVGLAEGDITTMASNMQIAFATTVTGMAAAAVGMLKLQFDQRFYASVYNVFEFLFISKQ